jgi:C4-dicarboxylate transporter, DctQ subunit
MCFRFLQVMVGFVQTGELPHHDHGHVEGLEDVAPLAPGDEDQVIRRVDDLHPRDLNEPPRGGDSDGSKRK